jgi:hypothetical protein
MLFQVLRRKWPRRLQRTLLRVIVAGAEGVTEASTPQSPQPGNFYCWSNRCNIQSYQCDIRKIIKSTGGHVVTLAYWQQKDKEPQDDIPYFI